MKNPFRKLEKQLGYRFRRKSLLHAALTHRSFRFEDDETQIDNLRMEFLGDAALGLLAAAWTASDQSAHCERRSPALSSPSGTAATLLWMS